MKNIRIVNNTGEDLGFLAPHITKSIEEIAPLPEEIADIFDLTILVGYNEDGSNRGILNWA